MRVRDLIVAVDIGTSATKAVLFDADVNQVAIAREHYPIHTPHKGWSEQEPEVILRAALEAIREITDCLPERSRILGISFSAQLCSLLAVDMDGRALTNSLIWSDTRSVNCARSISADPAAQGIHQRTGCPIDAMYAPARIRWLRENAELPGNARFISIKDYVIFRLTGQWVTDWSIASATGLLDIREQNWDQAALSLLDLTPANLSELVPPRFVLTEWNKEMADLVGVSPNTRLVVGGGDGPLASIGAGAYDSHSLAVNVGTSAAARSTIYEAAIDPDGRLWTYIVDENLWVIGGVVRSGGIVYDWLLRNLFYGTEETEEGALPKHVHVYAERLASAVPPGAENLIFIPYLGGELSPDWHPDTRGSFFGLDFVHSRGHLVRAVLEGITRSVYRVSERIQALLNGPVSEIRVTGGLTASPTWLQIAADMLGAPILVPESAEGSARGAAMLAMIALGLRTDIRDFADLTVARKRVEPREEIHAYYEKQYQRFQELLEYSRNSQKDWEV